MIICVAVCMCSTSDYDRLRHDYYGTSRQEVTLMNLGTTRCVAPDTCHSLRAWRQKRGRAAVPGSMCVEEQRMTLRLLPRNNLRFIVAVPSAQHPLPWFATSFAFLEWVFVLECVSRVLWPQPPVPWFALSLALFDLVLLICVYGVGRPPCP